MNIVEPYISQIHPTHFNALGRRALRTPPCDEAARRKLCHLALAVRLCQKPEMPRWKRSNTLMGPPSCKWFLQTNLTFIRHINQNIIARGQWYVQIHLLLVGGPSLYLMRKWFDFQRPRCSNHPNTASSVFEFVETCDKFKPFSLSGVRIQMEELSRMIFMPS